VSDLIPQVAADESAPNVPHAETPGPSKEGSASLWSDARKQLIRNPTFVLSALYILVVGSMAIFPTLWTDEDPRNCPITRSRQPPQDGHPFGFNVLGCDYYSHAVYGAQPSLAIAIGATVGIVLIGGTLGLLAGFYGGWVDTIISRTIDIFLSLPFLLGALVFLTVVKIQNILTITMVLVILGWTTIARVMRGTVLSAKNLDYVLAARSLGANNLRIMFRHILPNAVAPVTVLATIALGSFVAAEATLTFLGVGLRPPEESWGIMITDHQVYFLEAPWLLLFPMALLIGTVLSFILMGDALRDALDPKMR
jgi:peptide/nickel transport system permease protein/oligopeptide transport system permease protein